MAHLRKRRDDLSSEIRREKARQEAEARAAAERAKAEAERARAEEELAKKRELALKSAQQGLDSLVGLAGVKNRIEDWKACIAFDRENGNKASKAPLNMLFLGNPGTGKTEVARIMGKLMFGLGLLPTSSVVEVSRGDLVAGYIGQTAVKTKEQIARAMGGVLFVDEAYTLMPKDDGRDFGREALEEIMKAMEDHRGELAVIFAGYEKDMTRLFDVNQGLESRFPKSNRIHFEDFSADELLGVPLYLDDLFSFLLSHYTPLFYRFEPIDTIVYLEYRPRLPLTHRIFRTLLGILVPAVLLVSSSC